MMAFNSISHQYSYEKYKNYGVTIAFLPHIVLFDQ